MLGTTYTISGETNLPAGSKLLFEHDRTDEECRDTRLYFPPANSGMTASVLQVEQGRTDANIWRVIMNTSEFASAREFLVKIYSLDTPAGNRTTYNLSKATPETPWVSIDPISDQHRGTPVTAEIELPDKRTVPTSATQTPGFGFSILAITSGIAVIAGTLRRK